MVPGCHWDLSSTPSPSLFRPCRGSCRPSSRYCQNSTPLQSWRQLVRVGTTKGGEWKRTAFPCRLSEDSGSLSSGMAREGGGYGRAVNDMLDVGAAATQASLSITSYTLCPPWASLQCPILVTEIFQVHPRASFPSGMQEFKKQLQRPSVAYHVCVSIPVTLPRPPESPALTA